MKRALFVGIDDYSENPLSGCVADARAMATLLARNENGTRNYDVRLLTSDIEYVDRPRLRSFLADLFENARDAQLLFYFSGHGAESSWGAELVTQDFTPNSLGVSMNDVITLANDSPANEVVIILDCCFSGDLANLPGLQANAIASAFRLGKALVGEGVTLLTASRATEVSIEINGHGAFTRLLLEGLEGAAADHIGNVTALSLYDFASRAFSALEQRPVFKSHLTQPSVLRTCKPPIDPELLRQLPGYFLTADSHIRMTPEHEGKRPIPPGVEPTNEQKTFDYFKQLRNAGLLTTNQNKDLYFVALDSEEVFLTVTGRYFWRLAYEDRL
jgi:Caspase domain